MRIGDGTEFDRGARRARGESGSGLGKLGVPREFRCPFDQGFRSGSGDRAPTSYCRSGTDRRVGGPGDIEVLSRGPNRRSHEGWTPYDDLISGMHFDLSRPRAAGQDLELRFSTGPRCPWASEDCFRGRTGTGWVVDSVSSSG